MSAAAAPFVNKLDYSGRAPGAFRDQNRDLPRGIATALMERKVGQTIPLAGAAMGAGVSYWFTNETTESAFLRTRALYLKGKQQR